MSCIQSSFKNFDVDDGTRTRTQIALDPLFLKEEFSLRVFNPSLERGEEEIFWAKGKPEFFDELWFQDIAESRRRFYCLSNSFSASSR